MEKTPHFSHQDINSAKTFSSYRSRLFKNLSWNGKTETTNECLTNKKALYFESNLWNSLQRQCYLLFKMSNKLLFQILQSLSEKNIYLRVWTLKITESGCLKNTFRKLAFTLFFLRRIILNHQRKNSITAHLSVVLGKYRAKPMLDLCKRYKKANSSEELATWRWFLSRRIRCPKNENQTSIPLENCSNYSTNKLHTNMFNQTFYFDKEHSVLPVW